MSANSGEHRKHNENFAWSVYENPDLLKVTNRVIMIFMIVTEILNYAAGYALATYRDAPLAQDIIILSPSCSAFQKLLPSVSMTSRA